MILLSEIRSASFCINIVGRIQDHEKIRDGLENEIFNIAGVANIRFYFLDSIEIETDYFHPGDIDEESTRIWCEIMAAVDSWAEEIVMVQEKDWMLANQDRFLEWFDRDEFEYHLEGEGIAFLQEHFAEHHETWFDYNHIWRDVMQQNNPMDKTNDYYYDDADNKYAFLLCYNLYSNLDYPWNVKETRNAL